MKAKLLDRRNLYAAGLGSGIMLLLSLVCSAVAAGMVSKGFLPIGRMEMTGWVIAAISAWSGSLICGMTANSGRLPLCMLAGIGYLLVSFLLRGILFQSVTEHVLVTPICVMIPAAMGAVMTSGGRKRKR